MNIYDYGYNDTMKPAGTIGIPARVSAVHRERYAIICEYGETYARLKTKEYYAGSEMFPTVGDFVMINYIPNGDSQIIATLPRKTFFSRKHPDKGRGEQAVAANFDYVFIMQSMNMDFNTKRLERYLTLARQSGAVPLIVLTKADTADDHSRYISEAKRIAAGVSIHAVSAKTGFGMDTLVEYMQPGRTVVFLGSSGVGKSSLVNALAGEEIMAVNSIREDDSKGRHTTTHRQLVMMKNNVMVIDTPGMRELGMWDVSEGLNEAFADVEAFLGRCRFSDCTHGSEPGCAVRTAIESGELDAARWKSYCALRSEARFTDDMASYAREKQQWHKGIRKQQKQIRKRNSKRE